MTEGVESDTANYNVLKVALVKANKRPNCQAGGCNTKGKSKGAGKRVKGSNKSLVQPGKKKKNFPSAHKAKNDKEGKAPFEDGRKENPDHGYIIVTIVFIAVHTGLLL